MIYFTSNILQRLVFTLQEKKVYSNSNYLFQFSHRSLNNEFDFQLTPIDNISPHKDRYDMFEFNGSEFDDQPDGEWVYKIWEWNVIDEEVVGLLESGILRKNPIVDTDYTEYQTDNTFITR